MNFSRLIATVAATLAFATPVTASVVTYNVSTTTADITSIGFGFADGPAALSLNARFTIDPSQAFNFGGLTFFQSTTPGATSLVSASLSDNGAGLPAGLTAGIASLDFFGSTVNPHGDRISARATISTDVLDGDGNVIGFRTIQHEQQLYQVAGGPSVTVGDIDFIIPQVGDLIRLELGYFDQTDYLDGITPGLLSYVTITAYGIYGAQASDSFSVGSEGPTDAPEPASLALLGVGLAGVAFGRWTRVKA